MTYKEIIAEVSRKTNLPRELVDKTYRGYWRAVKEHIEALPMKKELTDEEFIALQPNVNIPSIGKLNVTLNRYKAIKQLFKRNTDKINKTTKIK